jgi:hypothetical protein
MFIMKSLFYLPLSLSAVIIFSACQKTANAPQLQSQSQEEALTNTTNTLIYRFSFETNDHDTSFKGWTGYFHGFSKDVPPNSGVWSLYLYPELIPYGGYAEHIIKADTGSYRLRFSCYTKIQSNSTNTGTGYLRLIKESISTASTNGQRKTLAETSFTNQDWEINHVTAAVNIKPGDVIIIQVSAGVAELITWTTLFDHVKVEKL